MYKSIKVNPLYGYKTVRPPGAPTDWEKWFPLVKGEEDVAKISSLELANKQLLALVAEAYEAFELANNPPNHAGVTDEDITTWRAKCAVARHRYMNKIRPETT